MKSILSYQMLSIGLHQYIIYILTFSLPPRNAIIILPIWYGQKAKKWSNIFGSFHVKSPDGPIGHLHLHTSDLLRILKQETILKIYSKVDVRLKCDGI